MDAWIRDLQALNERLKGAFSDDVLLPRAERRRQLERLGQFRTLAQLGTEDAAVILGGRPLVGVDGTINLFGGAFPHYLALLRALAKPNHGASLTVGSIYCPLPSEDGAQDELVAMHRDDEIRQRELARLEVEVAIQALETHQPSVILMDGPLVRFYNRVMESFDDLSRKVKENKILLVGVIENIESSVINTMLASDNDMPQGWRHRQDHDILWATLDYGEILELDRPAYGLPESDDEEGAPLRRWFMRPALAQGVVGLELLDEQVELARQMQIPDLLFSMTPPDGRGIPVWLDLVDREVRLTDVELAAYVELLDPDLRRILQPKRQDRIF